MKTLKRIFSLLVILSISWLGYASWNLYSEEELPIEAGFTLLHSLITFTALLAFRISLINQKKASPINLLMLFGALTLNTIQWAYPGTIDTLWTYLLIALTLLFSGSINALIQGNNRTTNIIRYSIWFTGILMSILILLKSDSPVMYMGLLFLLLGASLLSIFGIFSKPSQKNR